MARPSPPMSSSSWFQPWPPETSSSWTISALTRALPCAPRSKPPAPISSTCRPTVPTSIPSSRSSPSSKHSYARPPHAPSMLYGTPSENSSSASLHTNVPTTSPMLAMVYLAGIRSRASIAQDDAQQRLVDFDVAVVADEAQLPELVHEQDDPGPRRADDLGQGFLADRRRDLLRPAVLAEVGEQKQRACQPLLAGIEQLVDQILLDAAVAREQVGDEQLAEG